MARLIWNGQYKGVFLALPEGERGERRFLLPSHRELNRMIVCDMLDWLAGGEPVTWSHWDRLAELLADLPVYRQQLEVIENVLLTEQLLQAGGEHDRAAA